MQIEETKVDAVLSGFLALNQVERQLLMDRMSEYLRSTPEQKDRISEALQASMSMHRGDPAGSSCPFCGR